MILKFLEKLDTLKHIAILYDNSEQVKEILHKFFQIGLANNEICIYLMSKNENVRKIRNEIKKSGIDIEFFEKRKLLYFYYSPDILKNPEGILDAVKKFSVLIFSGSPTSRYRICGKVIPDISTETELSIQLAIEKQFHAEFEKFNGIVICVYNFKEIGETNYEFYLKKITETHHNIITIKNGVQHISETIY